MKAVLLAAGVGQRLRPVTNLIPKQMIGIGGKPLLEYIINDIISLGFDKICIVIGHHGDQIKNYFDEVRRFNVTIEYVTQQEYKGTADATNYARKFVGKDKFLLYLSDTIIPKGLHEHVQCMLTEDSEANILSAKVSLDKIANAGNIEDENGYVKKIVEKSSTSKSDLAWAGVALFRSNSIFQIIEKLTSSLRGEYEITDAMNLMLANNELIKNHICDEYIDAGTPDGLIEATKFILTNRCQPNRNNAELTKFEIIEPVYIGKQCSIGNNVKIGPFVSIGNNVTIEDNVELKETLVLDDSNISRNQNIVKSIVTKDGRILSS